MCLYSPPTTIPHPTSLPFGQAKGSTHGSCFGGSTFLLSLRTFRSYIIPVLPFPRREHKRGIILSSTQRLRFFYKAFMSQPPSDHYLTTFDWNTMVGSKRGMRDSLSYRRVGTLSRWLLSLLLVLSQAEGSPLNSELRSIIVQSTGRKIATASGEIFVIPFHIQMRRVKFV